MKILLSIADGYFLGETSRVQYSPGYENPNLTLTEHQVLCKIANLVEAGVLYAGHQILCKLYDDPKQAEFMFDKARHAKGCDVAIFLALNTSQNNTAQFSTCMVHMIQNEDTRNLFESTMFMMGRHIPVQLRYPNQMRRAPFLETCRRNNVPAVISMPFFYTDRNLTDQRVGQLIEASAKAITEAILSYSPSKQE